MVHKKNFLLTLITLLILSSLLFQNIFAYSSNTILKYGMTSSQVTQLQKDLKKLKFMSVNATGYFGSITKSAVIKFQKKYKLKVDGIAGSQTLAKIDKLLGRNSSIDRGGINRITELNMPAVNKQWIPGLPKNPYNKGVGMYEGVVLHYTNNSSDTAQSEANYEKKTWRSAFVHEFVDPDQIIQVANPLYLCYGSGKYGNHRFIQIELCHADNISEFEKSYQMYCERAAEYLYARKLGVTPAKSNGSGTLWSHNDVSQYLGGTDHDDPIAYLKKWGITWQDVISDVTEYYVMLSKGDNNSTSTTGSNTGDNNTTGDTSTSSDTSNDNTTSSDTSNGNTSNGNTSNGSASNGSTSNDNTSASSITSSDN